MVAGFMREINGKLLFLARAVYNEHMRKKLLILGAVFVIAAPLIALAAGLVPCGTSTTEKCNLCHLFVLGKNITTFLTGTIAPALAVLAFALAGFKILTSGGSPGARQEGIKIIRNTIIGLLIVFGAWIIINELLIFFAGTLYETDKTPGILKMPWSEIVCISPLVTKEAVAIVPIPAGIPVKSGACSSSSCSVNTAIAAKLTTFNSNLSTAGISWQITEAYPPTVTHKDPCHKDGTCVDANFTGSTSPTVANIISFINAASTANLKAIYEVQTAAERDALIAGGVPSGKVIAALITAPHFSVYNN